MNQGCMNLMSLNEGSERRGWRHCTRRCSFASTALPSGSGPPHSPPPHPARPQLRLIKGRSSSFRSAADPLPTQHDRLLAACKLALSAYRTGGEAAAVARLVSLRRHCGFGEAESVWRQHAAIWLMPMSVMSVRRRAGFV